MRTFSYECRQAESSVNESADDTVDLRSSFLLFNAMPSWAVSGLIHFAIFVLLALIVIPEKTYDHLTNILSPPRDKSEEIQELRQESIAMRLETLVSNSTSTEMITHAASDIQPPDTPTVVPDVEPAQATIDLSEVAEKTAPKNVMGKALGAFSGNAFAGRGQAMRGKLAAGATTETEAAVARALQWLAAHQLADGGWNFDHRGGLCNGRCADAGHLSACRTGATAIVLLPFLGAGQTHKEGAYKKTVHDGLYFLISQLKLESFNGVQTGNLSQAGGSMYSHGLAAIVLNEAYAMTQDKSLRTPAQLSLNYIMYAQDPIGGGWRYSPRQPGDTSVVGWQLMALKSGHMAYLHVNPNTISGATKFLDSVQIDNGSGYGYTESGRGPATTAVGLLCRMYLGWKKDHPGIQRGVEFLSATGPSKTNMYFNYYATQVMRQYDGPMWDKWNKEMRDWLVASQAKKEDQHDFGSWTIKGDHGSDAGGRLYCTAMATMILEVYYRHLPIYTKHAAEDDFPLK